MNATEHDACFATWTRDHRAILVHVVQAFAEGADRHDLMQEILLALWRAIPGFRGGSRPSTYVYRVAHSTALTWRRSEATHRRRSAEAIDADWMMSPDDGRARSDTPARLHALYAALRDLQPVDRSIMLMALDGASYHEISEVHGLSESHVGVRLTRARQQLTRVLNPSPASDHAS